MLAATLAREVHRQAGTEAEIAERVGLVVSSEQFANVVAHALSKGWVRAEDERLEPGDKKPPGPEAQPQAKPARREGAASTTPKRPKRERALALAAFVRSASSPVPAAAAAAHLGLAPGGSFPRVVRYAREHGWIDSRAGSSGGGYIAGQVPPPSD